MLIQQFLRGVCDEQGQLDEEWALDVLTRTGLRSAWLRKNGPCDPMYWVGVATQDALEWHVTRFEEVGHPIANGDPFHQHSPFVSLTAGTVELERHSGGASIELLPAWRMALGFATQQGTKPGWIFHGYVSLLGRAALPLTEYGEEIRDLHQHDFANWWHDEGEIAAKFLVPPVRLECAVRVTPHDLQRWVAHREDLGPHICTTCFDPVQELGTRIENPDYWRPEAASNVRSFR